MNPTQRKSDRLFLAVDGGSTMASLPTSLKGLFRLGPRKKDPREVVSTKDDIRRLLVWRCVDKPARQRPHGMEQAFRARCTTDTATGTNYWTETSFQALLDEEPGRAPSVSAAGPLLYRILLAWAAFPYRPNEDVRLDWEGFIQAAGLLSPRGQSLLSTPGYQRRDTENQPQDRQRGSKEQCRLVFQALTGPSFVEGAPGVTLDDTDENEDLLDALAICMDIDDDKFMYYEKDFTSAIATLPGSQSRRKLGCMISWADLETLVRCIVGITVRWYDVTYEDSTVEERDIERATIRILAIFHRQENAREDGVSWPAFHDAIETEAPNLLAALNPFLFHVCLSLVYQKPFKKSNNPLMDLQRLEKSLGTTDPRELLHLIFTRNAGPRSPPMFQ